MIRSKVLETIEKMPERFELDQLVEKLIFINKVEEGLVDVENGNLIEHEEVLRQTQSWLKS